MQLYIEKIRIEKEYRNLKKGLIIDFKPITLLVGEQGCGKSSLLNLLHNQIVKEHIFIQLSDYAESNGIEFFYFDTESMNPRISGIDNYTNPDGTEKGIGIGKALVSRFKSHGECMADFTVNILKQAENCILFLDEPEAALSLKNQYRLAKEINDLPSRNVQIIAATHCLPLIESVSEVYDLEHKKWQSSEKFTMSCKLKSNKTDKKIK